MKLAAAVIGPLAALSKTQGASADRASVHFAMTR